LFSSISTTGREAGLDGIADVIRCEEPVSGINMAQQGREKTSDRDSGGEAELQAETGLDRERISPVVVV